MTQSCGNQQMQHKVAQLKVCTQQQAVNPENKRRKPLGGGHHPKILLTTSTVKSPAEKQWTPTQIWFRCQEWWFNTQPIRYEKVHYSFNEVFEGKAPKQVWKWLNSEKRKLAWVFYSSWGMVLGWLVQSNLPLALMERASGFSCSLSRCGAEAKERVVTFGRCQ